MPNETTLRSNLIIDDPIAKKILDDGKKLFGNKKLNEALNHFKNAAKSNVNAIAAEAHYLIAKCYQSLKIGGLELQHTHLQKAVDKGFDKAKLELTPIKYQLAKACLKGMGIKQDAKQAITLFEVAAEQKHADALTWLGSIYENGEYVAKDSKKAVAYYERASTLQNPNATHCLAHCYVNGTGVEKDLDRAKELFLQAEAKLSEDIRLYQSKCTPIASQSDQKAQSKDKLLSNSIPDAKYANEECITSWLSSTVYGDAKELFLQAGILLKDKNHPNFKPDLAFIYLDKAAELGDAYAVYLVGKHYLIHLKNPKAAIIHLEKAAKMQEPNAAFCLAGVYAQGLNGVNKDINKAIQYYQQAANQNYLKALYALGRIYLYDERNDGVVDLKKGIELIQAAAIQGHAAAQYTLGNAYSRGIGVDKNIEKAKEWFLKSVQNGSNFPQLLLDVSRFFHEINDAVQGAKFLKQAAEKGSIEAQYILAERYFNGRGIEKSIELAIKYAEMCAKHIHDEFGKKAARFLGTQYRRGTVFPQDINKGFYYTQLAAENGDGYAQYYLGICYQYGTGIEKDDTKAYIWFEKAAKNGIKEAYILMGRAYLFGHGKMQKDEKAAVEWIEKAANNANTEAQLIIANMYESGIGKSKDEKESITWVKKAADLGNPVAQLRMARAYRSGAVLPKDLKQASEIFQQVANQSIDKSALLEAGKFFQDVNPPHKNLELSAKYLKKSAELGDAEAQFLYAKTFITEKNEVKDRKVVDEWFTKAANNPNSTANHLLYIGRYFIRTRREKMGVICLAKSAKLNSPNALLELGQLHEDGNMAADLPINKALALDFYKQAALLGDIEAQYKLGLCYENGLGTEKDISTAKFWYIKAADQNDNQQVKKNAIKKLDDIKLNESRIKDQKEQFNPMLLSDHFEENPANKTLAPDAQILLSETYKQHLKKLVSPRCFELITRLKEIIESKSERISEKDKNSALALLKKILLNATKFDPDPVQSILESEEQSLFLGLLNYKKDESDFSPFAFSRYINWHDGTKRSMQAVIFHMLSNGYYLPQDMEFSIYYVGIHIPREYLKVALIRLIEAKSSTTNISQVEAVLIKLLDLVEQNKLQIEVLLDRLCRAYFETQESVREILLDSFKKVCPEKYQKAFQSSFQIIKTFYPDKQPKSSLNDSKAVFEEKRALDSKHSPNLTDNSLPSNHSNRLTDAEIQDLRKVRQLAPFFDEKNNTIKKLSSLLKLDTDKLESIINNVKINAQNLQLYCENVEQKNTSDKNMQFIYKEGNEHLKDYYIIFYRTMVSTILACSVLQSGKVDDVTSTTADTIADGIDFIGKQIPGISIGTSIITKIIRMAAARGKNIYLNGITNCFLDIAKSLETIKELAQKITLAQKDTIVELNNKHPSTLSRLKTLFSKLKDYLKGNDVDNDVKKLAAAHADIILTAIVEEKLKLDNQHEQPKIDQFILSCITEVKGSLVIDQALDATPVVEPSPQSPSSPVSATSSNSSVASDVSSADSKESSSNETSEKEKRKKAEEISNADLLKKFGHLSQKFNRLEIRTDQMQQAMDDSGLTPQSNGGGQCLATRSPNAPVIASTGQEDLRELVLLTRSMAVRLDSVADDNRDLREQNLALENKIQQIQQSRPSCAVM